MAGSLNRLLSTFPHRMFCSQGILGKKGSTNKLSWHTWVFQRVPERKVLLPIWYFYWSYYRKLCQKSSTGQHYAVSGAVTSLLRFEGKFLFRYVHFHSRKFSPVIICPICAPFGSITAFGTMSSFITPCISGRGKSLWSHRDSFVKEEFSCNCWCVVFLIQWAHLTYCQVTFFPWLRQFYGPNLTANANFSPVGWQAQLKIKLWMG